MRIIVDIDGTDLPDFEIEQVWDHFFFQTPSGTRIKVTKVEDDGTEVSFE